MNDIYIEENESILDAMRQLNKSARKILFVHKEGKLKASLTDGDIRRWILKKGDLQMPVKCMANYQPRFLPEEQADLAVHIMKEYEIDAIPILDDKGVIKRVIFSNESKQEHNLFPRVVPVVIMAGGMGTRLSPYTNILPKPLIPIGDYPIVEHIIDRFCTYGCKQFYMIVNYKRNMIKAYFDELDKAYQLNFITEEKQLGTGGGISLLKGEIEHTFILSNCDILINDDLVKAYEQHVEAGNIITMVCSLKNFTIPYGIVNIGEDGIIQSIEEKPNVSFFTNTGCYFVEPEVINDLKYNEPIDFPEIIEKYLKNNKRIGIYPIGEEAWLDMGQIDELEKMKVKLGC